MSVQRVRASVSRTERGREGACGSGHRCRRFRRYCKQSAARAHCTRRRIVGLRSRKSRCRTAGSGHSYRSTLRGCLLSRIPKPRWDSWTGRPLRRLTCQQASKPDKSPFGGRARAPLDGQRISRLRCRRRSTRLKASKARNRRLRSDARERPSALQKTSHFRVLARKPSGRACLIEVPRSERFSPPPRRCSSALRLMHACRHSPGAAPRLLGSGRALGKPYSYVT